jgi:hypothetical protein
MAAKPRTERKHQDQLANDLSPNRMAGQNIGAGSADQEHGLRTAYDIEELHRTLREEFAADELKNIPVIPEGQRLQQGGVYIDLHDHKRKEFTAAGDMTAGAKNFYASKSEVPYSLWNRLMGVENSERVLERRREQS